VGFPLMHSLLCLWSVGSYKRAITLITVLTILLVIYVVGICVFISHTAKVCNFWNMVGVSLLWPIIVIWAFVNCRWNK
jgi:hypothetical protein